MNDGLLFDIRKNEKLRTYQRYNQAFIQICDNGAITRCGPVYDSVWITRF